ncbi:hypothetical protein F5144DRAFT_520469 [Chaetomium tenue]|uniref:Uncharacterized protein n=1 Tax=Chaetomium tenue TaxID=1854479 RepID=A0ACB7NXE8_9PEZI|nr:hypothetical protein F5144DRAFT_520469 [Chaetomium globosum]
MAAGSTRPSNRAEAQRLVQSIADDRRPIPDEVLDRMSDADQRQVEHAILMKDQVNGPSVLTLAQNLYTSNARFVLELLQNAEDNDYTKAQALGDEPYVSFSVYPSQVVLEYNEDGFTEENLRAICSVGQSSKIGARGYIGDKGIGFKSVFMAAHRVHVQSGHFSFHFRHRQGDSGLGMITPIWEYAFYLGGRHTRITLDLIQGGTPEEQVGRNQTIRQQFEQLHDAILLFMKKIKKIKVAFYDNQPGGPGEPASTITHSIDRQSPITVCTKHTSQKGHEQTQHRYYYVKKGIATGLSKAEGRIYSQSEEASGAYSRGEVVLAFPLTADSVPILENQWVFSFLPVRQMGFKFLVHADFVMQADRQDIAHMAARNRELATKIAKDFIKAVLELCKHETLQYQWMRYLPEENVCPWGDFLWRGVAADIRMQIRSTPVLRAAIPGPLRLIESVRRHQPTHLDASGEPLLPGIDPLPSVSPRYESADLDRLRDLGLKDLDIYMVVSRIKSDLAAPVSRIRTTQDEDWQSRLARLFHYPFVENTAVSRKMQKALHFMCRELTKLNLLPLTDGTWTSGISGPIYYSRVKDTNLDIPPGLPLRMKIIDPTAAANADRKQFFDTLGVRHAPAALVRAVVLDRYRNAHPTLLESVSHLHFLYLTEHLADHRFDGDQTFQLYSHHERLEDATQTDVFLRDDDGPYGAAQLLRATPPGLDAGAGAPGLDMLFAHPAYFQDPPKRRHDFDGGWEQWLTRVCGLQPCVTWIRQAEADTEEREMTTACRYVAQHRPEKFLGFLRAIWKRHGLHLEPKDSAIIEDLSWTPVLCKGPGINLRPLNSTFLPIRELVTVCDRFMLDGEFFPWLELDTPLSNNAAPIEWRCLGSAFGLGYDHDLLGLALGVLKSIVEANPLAEDLRQPERMLKLYEYLQDRVRESRHRGACREKIRDAFASLPSIFVPGTETNDPAWAEPQDCLWNSPIEMLTKYTLARAYTPTFTTNDDSLIRLEAFFVRTLGIPNCSWEHVVEELRDYTTGIVFINLDLSRARELYKCLSEMRLQGTALSKLKETFEREALICGFDEAWYRTSDCLWSSATPVRSKLILDNLYGNDMRDFFVGVLGVSDLTAELVYDKLAAKNGPELSVEEAKKTLFSFTSLLVAGSGVFDPAAVIANPVFPVRFPDGKVGLCTGTTSFALMDRKLLGQDFATLAKFLDFDMEEVRILQPLFQWAGMEDRYLSRAVNEITSADTESSRPISTPHRDIRGKAHALLRIAVTYNSPRARHDSNLNEFYTFLRNSETLEIGKITAELLLTQDDTELRVEKDSALLHIREDVDGLKVYVPEDKRSQEVCFNSKLSRRLCEWMMTDPATQLVAPVPHDAVAVIQSVLNAQPFTINDILDEHGILEVNVAERDIEILVDEKEVYREEIPTEISNNNSSRPETPTSRHHASTEFSSNDSPGLATPLSSSVVSPGVISSVDMVARSTDEACGSQSRLVDANGAGGGDPHPSLLQSIVDAPTRAASPPRGAFDMSAVNAALPRGLGGDDAVIESLPTKMN